MASYETFDVSFTIRKASNERQPYKALTRFTALSMGPLLSDAGGVTLSMPAGDPEDPKNLTAYLCNELDAGRQPRIWTKVNTQRAGRLTFVLESYDEPQASAEGQGASVDFAGRLIEKLLDDAVLDRRAGEPAYFPEVTEDSTGSAIGTPWEWFGPAFSRAKTKLANTLADVRLSFTADADSAGRAWGRTTISPDGNGSLLKLANALVEARAWDYYLDREADDSGYVMHAFNFGTLGVDRTIGTAFGPPIQLIAGKNVQAARFSRGNAMRGTGLIVISEDGTLRGEFGTGPRWEKEAMTYTPADQAAIDLYARLRFQQREEGQVVCSGMYFGDGRSPRPGVDFQVGDRINVRVSQRIGTKGWSVQGYAIVVLNNGAEVLAETTVGVSFREIKVRTAALASAADQGDTGGSGGDGYDGSDGSGGSGDGGTGDPGALLPGGGPGFLKRDAADAQAYWAGSTGGPLAVQANVSTRKTTLVIPSDAVLDPDGTQTIDMTSVGTDALSYANVDGYGTADVEWSWDGTTFYPAVPRVFAANAAGFAPGGNGWHLSGRYVRLSPLGGSNGEESSPTVLVFWS